MKARSGFALGLTLGLGACPAARAFAPALLNTQAEFAFIRARVEAGSEPWKSGFEKMRASSFAALTFVPKPREIVDCGYYHKPDNGCSDESNSSRAAYTHALMWALTGKAAHAAKAAEILDAWSARLRQHTNKNAPLQAGWNGSMFPRAALILRDSYPAWDRSR